MGIGTSFLWRDALPHQPVQIRKKTLESGNLLSASGSWISASFIALICLKHPTGMDPTAYTSYVLDPHYKADLL